MLGAVLGDIVGSVYEFKNIRTKEFPLISKNSTFTDDTVMTFAIAKAILVSKKNHYKDEEVKKECIKQMHEFGYKYPGRGYGGMFYTWLYTDREKPYNSFGNGSAMRVSSVGWLFDTLEEVEHYAKLTAEVTQNHPEGIKGAQAIASCIYLARQGQSKEYIKTYVSETYGYSLDEPIDHIREHYTFNETCQGSVPQAIRAFYESEDYEDALRNAISIGGDSDTIACMSGAIAEAYYGMPEELKEMALDKITDEMREIYGEFGRQKRKVIS